MDINNTILDNKAIILDIKKYNLEYQNVKLDNNITNFDVKNVIKNVFLANMVRQNEII
jgi:hypothetical protein